MYLSLKQLAEYSSLCENTLRKLMKLGMPFYRIGKSVRVRQSEFDSWMKRFQVESTKEGTLESAWLEVLDEVQK